MFPYENRFVNEIGLEINCWVIVTVFERLCVHLCEFAQNKKNAIFLFPNQLLILFYAFYFVSVILYATFKFEEIALLGVII